VAQDPAPAAATLDVLLVAPHLDDERIGGAGVTRQAIARATASASWCSRKGTRT
jgi:LmbE family N-acetylglucosaminyl deacetylase